MSNWHEAGGLYRGGGNFSDAICLLAEARNDPPGMTLDEFFTVDAARGFLDLPCGLPVPDGPGAVRMKTFNNDATSGPYFRAFGVKGKFGMKAILEQFTWEVYEGYVARGGDEKSLPFITSRVGYRTKLMPQAEAFEKMKNNKPLGRCVMMLDAIEQAFSSPLYNVLSKLTAARRFEKASGFRNAVVRASSDWMKLWAEVSEAKAVVELDWKKFDRERPTEDLLFMIEVICSCFEPTNERETLLLSGYKIMLRRALVERIFVCDDGGVFKIDGMVPSGSLWTGWLDTALNILYLRAALINLGITQEDASPKCAGDDNLTLFYTDYPERVYSRLRRVLNEWFRAGIEEKDFIVHHPPFGVTKVQACFPPGTDLSLGTSRMLEMAEWVPFEDALVIDQSSGRSHRWKYVFEGKPKFLSCYWLPDGRPIRPAHVNAEKLLFPEGIHKDLSHYEAAVLSMVVDNPWNQHNINHMMHRFVICQQVRRQAVMGISPVDILWYAKIRGAEGEEIPFPMIASWRRTKKWVDMEQLPYLKKYIDDFRDFVSGVTSLYSRDATGGIDAWRFMDFIRGESDLGEGQFGNEIDAWLKWLYAHPLTKYLRPLRRFKEAGAQVEPDEATRRRIDRGLHHMRELLGTRESATAEDFAIHVSNLLLDLSQDQAR